MTDGAPFVDRGHLRDGRVYCTDPECPVCDEAISLRERALELEADR